MDTQVIEKGFERVWQMFQETDKKFQESAEQLKKIENMFIGKWGRFMEVLIDSGAVTALRQYRLSIEHSASNVREQKRTNTKLLGGKCLTYIGTEGATQFIFGLNPTQTGISVITRAEILVGLDEDGQARAKPLLDQYQLLIIDRPIADLSAQLRREHGWKLPDAFQAALVQHHKTKLTTRNIKDFDPRQHDFVETPYSIG